MTRLYRSFVAWIDMGIFHHDVFVFLILIPFPSLKTKFALILWSYKLSTLFITLFVVCLWSGYCLIDWSRVTLVIHGQICIINEIRKWMPSFVLFFDLPCSSHSEYIERGCCGRCDTWWMTVIVTDDDGVKYVVCWHWWLQYGRHDWFVRRSLYRISLCDLCLKQLLVSLSIYGISVVVTSFYLTQFVLTSCSIIVYSWTKDTMCYIVLSDHYQRQCRINNTFNYKNWKIKSRDQRRFNVVL